MQSSAAEINSSRRSDRHGRLPELVDPSAPSISIDLGNLLR
jgi:hypothetical protein